MRCEWSLGDRDGIGVVNTQGRGKRRVIIVAYHFPPDAEVGARRPLSFARYLPEHGWEPIVITVRGDYYERLDHDALQRIPESLHLVRTRQYPNLRTLIHSAKRVARGKRTGSLHDSSAVGAEVAIREKKAHVPAWKRHLNALSWTPDAMLGWYPPAVKAGKRLIDGLKPDAVIATGPPWTAHLVGSRLARYSQTPWIADFRDPWTLVDWKPDFGQTGWSRRFEKKKEMQSVYSASAVTFVTEQLRTLYAEAFPDRASVMRALYNGYDPAGVVTVSADSPSADGPVLIRHLGTLYVGRDFEPLLLGVKQLIEAGEASPNDFRIENIGRVELPEERFPQRLAESLGLKGVAISRPSLPATELPRLAAESDALVTICGSGHEFAIPYKTLEYLPSFRHVIVLAQPGESSRIVERAGAGQSVSPNDIDGMTKILRELLAARRAGIRLPGASPERAALFGADRRAGELAAILNEVIS